MEQTTTIEKVPQTLERTVILERIDRITQELSEVRRLVDRLFPSESSSLTLQLLGSLGNESIENYDDNLDWERFAQLKRKIEQTVRYCLGL